MFEYFNPNPERERAGDCTVRAICKATDQTWEKVYAGVCAMGFMRHDMPSSNHVWGAYLQSLGWKRRPLFGDDYYTVNDFCEEHPAGTYILAMDGHVACVQDGRLFDTWDCGDQPLLYYWAH